MYEAGKSENTAYIELPKDKRGASSRYRKSRKRRRRRRKPIIVYIIGTIILIASLVLLSFLVFNSVKFIYGVLKDKGIISDKSITQEISPEDEIENTANNPVSNYSENDYMPDDSGVTVEVLPDVRAISDYDVSILNDLDIKEIEGISALELPVSGATGFASVPINLYRETEDLQMATEIEEEINSLNAIREELKARLDIYVIVYRSRLESQEVRNQLPQGFDAIKGGGAMEDLMNTLDSYWAVEARIAELNESYAECAPLEVLYPGTPFCIIQEQDNFWKVSTGQNTGWLDNTTCFINLPDVIPSIVYNISNADSSLFKSQEKDIPDITGEKLFEARDFNARLGEEEFIVPVLYKMAKKIGNAQHIANQHGDTLVIYEGFRPMAAQQKVGDQLLILMDEDPQVKHGVSDSPWSIVWFIARSVSNHQKGSAIDVTIARIEESEEREIAGLTYSRTKDYTEYTMPTAMHELSNRAVLYTSPGSNTYAPGINNAAKRLQNICRKAGMSSLASEWWHFNDLQAEEISNESGAEGGFFTEKTMSSEPY